jgi:hypothetical protein
MDVAMGETTRRSALKLAGGLALLAVAGAGPGRAVLAHEASPVASPAGDSGLLGNYVVIRIRTLKADRSAEELLALIRDGFVPLVEDVPGFNLYFVATNPETRGLFSVGVFEDEAGAAESNQRAAEWVPLNAPDFLEGGPDVHEGPIGVTAEWSAPTAGGLVGKHLVIRLRQPEPDWPVDEVLALIGEGYVPLVQDIPGFVMYFESAVPGSGSQAYVGVFDDKTGADVSTRVAGEWLTDNAYTFFDGDPTVAEGAIEVAAETMG